MQNDRHCKYCMNWTTTTTTKKCNFAIKQSIILLFIGVYSNLIIITLMLHTRVLFSTAILFINHEKKKEGKRKRNRVRFSKRTLSKWVYNYVRTVYNVPCFVGSFPFHFASFTAFIIPFYSLHTYLCCSYSFVVVFFSSLAVATAVAVLCSPYPSFSISFAFRLKTRCKYVSCMCGNEIY